MKKVILIGICLLLLVSCRFAPSVIVATLAPTLTADEVMPKLKVITPNNAYQVQLFRTLEIPGYVRGDVSQCNTAFSPDGSLVLGVCGKNPVPVWEVETGMIKYTLYPEGVQLVSCAFSSEGSTIACGGFDKTVTLWNAVTGDKLAELAQTTSPVWDLAYSPDGNLLAACSIHGGIQVWEVASGNQVMSAETPKDCLSIAYDPSGKVLAYGGLYGKVGILDAASGESIAELLTSGDPVGDAAFSHDGSMLAAGRDDDMVYFWEVSNVSSPDGYSAPQKLSGHYHFVNGVAFSPDDKLVISSSHDTTTHLRNSNSLQIMKMIGGHLDVILRPSFNPAGTLIATISWDGTVKLWGIRK